MASSRMSSPAQSQGTISTPRRHRFRASRSVGSPTHSNTSAKLSTLIQEHKMESFLLSPLRTRRSVLSDNTEIEMPRRKSWWKRLEENSRDVMEVLENKEPEQAENVEEYIDAEILSQEKNNYSVDLPESSDAESISSIVIPQRRLFTQKDSQSQKVFGQIENHRENLAQLHRSRNNYDKTISVGKKNLFNRGIKERSKPVFPAALLNISANRTLPNKETENKGQVRSIFGNRPGTKRKNMFAEFVVSESEDEIPEIQPKVFEFSKKIERERPKSSTSHRVRDASPTSDITDIEIDEWKLLPSSTMVDNQFGYNEGNTPVKKVRLSKLIETKEITKETSENEINKTKQSNKSISKRISKTSKFRNGKDFIISETSEHGNNDQSEEKPDTVQNKSDMNSTKNNKSKNKSIKDVTRTIKNSSQGSDMNKTENNQDTHKEKSKVTHTPAIETEKSVKSSSLEQIQNDEDGDNFTLHYEKEDYNHENIDDHNHTNDENKVILAHHETNITTTKKELSERDTSLQRNKSLHNSSFTKSSPKVPRLLRSSNANTNKGLQDDIKSLSKNDLLLKSITNQSINNVSRNLNQKQPSGEDLYEDNNANNSSSDVPKKDKNLRSSFPDERTRLGPDSNEILNNDISQPTTNKLDTKQRCNETKHIQDKSQKDIIDEMDVFKTLTGEAEAYEVMNYVEKKSNNDKKDNVVEREEENKNIATNVNQDQDYIEEGDANENSSIQEAAVEDGSDDMEVSQDQSVSENEEGQSEENDEENVEGQSEEDDKENEEDADEEDLEEDDEDKQDEDDKETVKEDDESRVEEYSDIESSSEDKNVEEEDLGQDVLEESNHSAIEEENEIVPDHNESQPEKKGTSENEEELKSDVDQSDLQNDIEERNENQEIVNQSKSQQNKKEEYHKALTIDSTNYEHTMQKKENPLDDLATKNETIGKNKVVEEASTEDLKDGKENTQTKRVTLNSTHDTTGRYRQRIELGMKSPEEILHYVPNEMESFSAHGRNTSIRKTKSIIKINNVKPSLAPLRESTGISDDGSKNSSVERSGWDSHRTTRKTLRQTFGKDFTPRKSLRALVMEKSAKRQTYGHDMTVKAPQACSTKLRGTMDVDMSEDDDDTNDDDDQTNLNNDESNGPELINADTEEAVNVQKSNEENADSYNSPSINAQQRYSTDGDTPEQSSDMPDNDTLEESDHEASRMRRQATLEMYLQKMKIENQERRRQTEEAIRNSLKQPIREPFNLFKVPARPNAALRRNNMKTGQTKSKMKQIKSSIIPIANLPPEVLEDMKYKPPRRYQPNNASWITKRLYKFLETKLEPKYDYKARVRAEKLVETMYNFTKDMRRHNVAPTDAVDVLKQEMARLNIVKTHFEFYEFFHEFMPREIRIKVVPDVVNKISLPKHGVFSDIIR